MTAGEDSGSGVTSVDTAVGVADGVVGNERENTASLLVVIWGASELGAVLSG